MSELPALPRAEVSVSRQGALTIVVPSRASPAVVAGILIATIAGVMFFGLLFVLVRAGAPADTYLFLIVPGLVMSGASMGLLWPLAGFERLVIDTSVIYAFGAIGVALRKRVFDPSQMSDLRLATQANNDQWRVNLWAHPPQFWKSQTVGMLTFDYGAEPFSFGTSLSALEAKMILEAVNARLKPLRSA